MGYPAAVDDRERMIRVLATYRQTAQRCEPAPAPDRVDRPPQRLLGGLRRRGSLIAYPPSRDTRPPPRPDGRGGVLWSCLSRLDDLEAVSVRIVERVHGRNALPAQ